MWFKFFHKHTWSTPHPAEDKDQSSNYIMRCYECGATREVQAHLTASTEVEKRIAQAKETLQKIKAS